MPEIIIAGRDDRIGARFANLLCGWRIANLLGLPFMWLWKSLERPTGNNYGLFSLLDRDVRRYGFQIYEFGPEEWSTSYGKEILSRHEEWHRVTKEKRSTLAAIADLGGIVHCSLTEPVYVSKAEAAREWAAMASLFACLPLNAQLADNLRYVESKIPLAECAAVHIRRGDIMNAPGTGSFRARFAPLCTYKRLLPTLNHTALIFSDDDAVKAELDTPASRYLYSLLDNLPWQAKHQRDFAEFLIISKCAMVIGTGSAFAAVAAKLNGAYFFNVRKMVRADEMGGVSNIWR